MKIHHALAVGAAAFTTALAVAAGGAAMAADDTLIGDHGVDVEVDVTPIDVPGVLALSVAGDSTTLAESGSDAVVRQFTGALPRVTVTDTRTAAEVPAGASWYVLGTASDFAGPGGATIAAEHLGWSPSLVPGAGDGEPFVSVGGDVDPAVNGQGGPGLVDRELLYRAESADAAGGSWSADAGLTLRVPTTVTPGTYTSTLTLSLFE